MKYLLYIVIASLLISCKKDKSFADDIVLDFPKDEKLKFQEFNEDLTHLGTSLIYIGESRPRIDVKYYKYILPPPLLPAKIDENAEAAKKSEDSIQLIQKPFFRAEKIQILKTTETLSDALNSENLSIFVREKDTIPLYKQNLETKKINKYKAFPVFIKNISNKVLKIPTDAKNVDLFILNNNKFQYIRNSNYRFVGMGSSAIPYFELKPDEILVYSCPYFKKGEKRKAKIKFTNTESKEFEMSIDENMVKKLRERLFE
ncbi:MAG: hypothetical protein P0Y62_13255 [Candidatus Chryseobacterium colombiense]|nr:hypothetical protein [Chryseobacterium sp.]WEK68811.1 MAG: hypothetical protein P0Y62_13255 [Chryseobacterium sp.]